MTSSSTPIFFGELRMGELGGLASIVDELGDEVHPSPLLDTFIRSWINSKSFFDYFHEVGRLIHLWIPPTPCVALAAHGIL